MRETLAYSRDGSLCANDRTCYPIYLHDEVSTMRVLIVVACVCLTSSAGLVAAQSLVAGGQTNVALNFDALSSAAGLTFSSVSSDVIAPGSIADSVAFPINSRSAATLPTTFAYDPGAFPAGGSFSGTIEHSGSVLFNSDTIELGNFTIGFDGARAGTLGGLASGFFVANNVSGAVPAPVALFDIQVTGASPLPSSLTVDGALLVSPELGAFLLGGGLSTINLQGTPVGLARVDATNVPEPASIAVLAITAVAAGGLLRRRSLR